MSSLISDQCGGAPVREVDPLDQLLRAHEYPRARIAVWPMGCEKETGHLQLQTEWLGEGQSEQRLPDLFGLDAQWVLLGRGLGARLPI